MDYYVIYKYPSDFPHNFVVRKYTMDDKMQPKAGTCTLFQSLESARYSIPQYMTCVHRHEKDDPVIVETWI